MRASDLRALVESLRWDAVRQFGDGAGATIDALSEAIARFEYRDAAEFAAKIKTIKPTASKPRVTSKTSRKKAESKPSHSVEYYIEALAAPSNDNHSATSVVETMKTDPGIKGPEVIQIAKALGIPVKSKTSKTVAINQILGLAAQRDAASDLNEKIRKGA